MFELHRRLRQRMDRQLRAEAGLTYSKYVLLKCIQTQQPRCTRATLAAASGFVSASLTDAVRGLLKNGLIVEVREVWDERRVWLRVSEAGQSAIHAASEVWDDELIRLLDVPPADEARGFMKALEMMIESSGD
ncbi:MarR family winged helix-turn-helix transcriptional regulator [Lysobacter sp. FW306-1B-D06B]|uniref:MarR family winged helix-turn-helix transcriptional regulator n=1 Tax=Lysobacter sp. FW306-1B-D06B TaxID=3140250 RepID=UPI00313FF6E7